MKRLKRKLFVIVAAGIAAFFAFVFPVGLFVGVAETSEISALESVLENNSQEDELYASDGVADVASAEESILESVDGTSENVDGTSESLDETSESVGGTIDEIINSGLDDIIPETEWSAWFKEKILPYILEFLAVAGGALATFALVLNRLNLRLGDLIDAVKVLRKANEDSDNTKAAVQEQKEEQLAWEKRQEEEKKAWQEQQMQIMEEGFAKIAESVTNKLDDAVNTVHKILDVEEIAYRENPIMVSKGTAHKIEEVIHGEKKNEPHDAA